jgi:Ca2+-transporting ATPase
MQGSMIQGNTLPAVDRREQIPTLAVPAVYAALASQAQGLSQDEAQTRLAREGPNTIREAKRQPLIAKFVANFTHLMALLLWAGGLIALVAQMPQLAIAIWLVNIINGAFSFWQEFKAERATEALRRLLPTSARVLRDGVEQRILAADLVPGDVMLLGEGDHISADARLVQEAELRIDQSTLSGESHPVTKTAGSVVDGNLAHAELPNLVFAGTSVAAGTGKAVVFATGMTTEFGKIAHLTQSLGQELSPLQVEIGTVTRVVTAIAVGIGLLFFLLAVGAARMPMAEGFIFALGMIVAFVPEGLLPTVTLALAMGVQRMVHRHALVKRLSAVETLGCTSVICTDKTGTLTQNEMTVRELWVAGRRLTASGAGYDPHGQLLDAGRPVAAADDPDLAELLRVAALCNNARLLPPNGESSRWTPLGDPTEAALVVAALKGGLDLAAEAARFARVAELPFESRRRRMSTVHRSPAGQCAYVKGAPNDVLELSTSIWLDGQAVPLSAALRAQVVAANDDYARGGLRVLAMARRSMPNDLDSVASEAVEQELCFVGLLAMMDPPRDEVAEAVQTCHRAGIRIVMITGDYGLTAESIARRVGIIRGDHPRIVTGATLDGMDEQALTTVLKDEVIFARVSPEHKLRVVSALQDLGHVVAVTGDGVNDAPALKKADIGVAMGLSGSDVAKEAADMILTDDNFASIVNAVEEGRAVYANIKKFTCYIFTSNTPEAVPFILFAFSAARIPLALTVMQILSIDLGTDMVPALALGVEPPEPGMMERPPRSRKEHVITRSLLVRAYLWLGTLQSVAAMMAFFFVYWTNGYWGRWLDLPGDGMLYRSATAMTLGAVVATQIGNLFAQRTERMSVFRAGFFSNRLVWAGIATELLLLVALVYVPWLQAVFGTAAFAAQNWVFLAAWMPVLLLADEARKAVMRARARHRAPVRASLALPVAK